MNEYIGIEIGGTKQQAASFDEQGSLVRIVTGRFPLPDGHRTILDWMRAQVPTLITPRTAGIGVGFGGILDTARGTAFGSVHVPGWDGFPIRDWFAEEFHMPTTVVNDTVCGGYAELFFGAGRGVDSFFYTNIGTGCGGGMFLNGKNLDGVGTGCAYFGQQFVPDWEHPGQVKRLEQMCAGSFTEARLRQEGYVPARSAVLKKAGGDASRITCKNWLDAAREGDAFALEELDRWSDVYALGLSNVLALLAPQVIALGGGVALAGETILKPIREKLEGRCFISMQDRWNVEICQTGEMAVLIGAALYARDGFSSL